MSRRTNHPHEVIHRASVVSDCYHLANHLRPQDCAEVVAAGSLGPLQALWAGYLTSRPHAWTTVVDGEPVAMYGVGKNDVVWCLASTRAPVRLFLTEGPKVLAKLLESHKRLWNFVHAPNARAVRWLRWLGFNVDTERVLVSAAGGNFHPFEIYACASQ